MSIDQYRVCKSLTTGLFYPARFAGEMVSQDHDPTIESPSGTFVECYRRAKRMADAAGIPVASAPVEFRIWPDIYCARPKPKPQKGKRK